MAGTLVVVLVLYLKQVKDCPGYDVLMKHVQKKSIHLLVYDNSPQGQDDPLLKKTNVQYLHDSENQGLAGAYNCGLNWFKELDAQLLLLLDQDTAVTSSYIDEISALSKAEVDGVGAFVPVVYSGSQQISPVFSDRYINRNSNFPEAGITSDALMAVNSGTVLTKKGLAAIKQFNEEFPLDFLDHWVFWMLHQQQLKIFVLSSTLEHDLSVLDYNNVSVERYESILSAESRFYKNYDQDKLKIHRNHLIKRILKQFLTVKNRSIWRRTLKEYRELVREEK